MLKYDVTMVLQSPLAHNDEQALSTTTPFRKLKLVVDGKPLDVPPPKLDWWKRRANKPKPPQG